MDVWTDGDRRSVSGGKKSQGAEIERLESGRHSLCALAWYGRATAHSYETQSSHRRDGRISFGSAEGERTAPHSAPMLASYLPRLVQSAHSHGLSHHVITVRGNIRYLAD